MEWEAKAYRVEFVAIVAMFLFGSISQLETIPQAMQCVDTLLKLSPENRRVWEGLLLDRRSINSSLQENGKKHFTTTWYIGPNRFPVEIHVPYVVSYGPSQMLSNSCVNLEHNLGWKPEELKVLYALLQNSPLVFSQLQTNTAECDNTIRKLKLFLTKLPRPVINEVKIAGSYFPDTDNIAIVIGDDMDISQCEAPLYQELERVFYHEFFHLLSAKLELEKRWIASTKKSTGWRNDIWGNFHPTCSTELTDYARTSAQQKGGSSGVKEDMADSFAAWMQGKTVSADRREFFEMLLLPNRERTGGKDLRPILAQ